MLVLKIRVLKMSSVWSYCPEVFANSLHNVAYCSKISSVCSKPIFPLCILHSTKQVMDIVHLLDNGLP